MNESWYALRQDVFIRDLVRDFLEAKLHFNKLQLTYRKTSSVPFKRMDSWVGTEVTRGPLWNLKDQCHRLFRGIQSKSDPFERLFDWTIGSIFHEAMKLKEDSYQIELYKPLLQLELTRYKHDKAISAIIKEYFMVIENANRNLALVLDNIDSLFEKAVYHFKQVIFKHKSNVLMIRFLLDNKRLLDRVLGKNSFSILFQQIFPEGLYHGYIVAAEYCTAHGWFDDASRYLKQSSKLRKAGPTDPNHMNKVTHVSNKLLHGGTSDEKSKSGRHHRQ